MVNALKLPRNRKGTSIDTTAFVNNMLTLWVEYRYSPSIQVWEQFVIAGSSFIGDGDQDEAKFLPLIKACEIILHHKNMEAICLDSIILKRFFKAVIYSNRLDFASRLIEKYVSDELMKLKRDNQYYIQIPIFDILQVLELCTSSGDVDSCRVILSSMDRISKHISPSHIRMLCVAGLQTFSKGGAMELAAKLISYMQENNLNPG
jgi:hypothetical protein